MVDPKQTWLCPPDAKDTMEAMIITRKKNGRDVGDMVIFYAGTTRYTADEFLEAIKAGTLPKGVRPKVARSKRRKVRELFLA